MCFNQMDLEHPLVGWGRLGLAQMFALQEWWRLKVLASLVVAK